MYAVFDLECNEFVSSPTPDKSKATFMRRGFEQGRQNVRESYALFQQGMAAQEEQRQKNILKYKEQQKNC
jgi:hypothetical protein